MRLNPYNLGLERNQANYVPVSPLSFLRRVATVYPERTAVVHGEGQWTWHDVHVRTRRLASALRRHGVGPGDTVAVMAPNVPAVFEAHYAIPMAGAVMNALNTTTDPILQASRRGRRHREIMPTPHHNRPIIHPSWTR